MKTIHALELEALRQTNPPVEILDIRPHLDFEKGHINGAHSLPLAEVSPETVLLSRQLLATEPLYLVSQSGAFAQLGACELEHQGLDNVVVVAGGMHAWQRDGLPTVKNSDRPTLAGAWD